jgi:hypothetical protein
MGSGTAEARRFGLLWEDRYVRVFERYGVPPRAYFVPQARVLTDPDTVLRTLDSPAFDPHAEVVLEEPLPETLADLTARPGPRLTRSVDPGSVRIIVDEPERVVIVVDAAQPGFAVLSDLFYPGWKAFVGASEIPVYRANYLFRAVRLPVGHSQVSFEYRPASVRYGVALSVCTVLVLAVLSAWMRPKQRGDQTDGSGP